MHVEGFTIEPSPSLDNPQVLAAAKLNYGARASTAAEKIVLIFAIMKIAR